MSIILKKIKEENDDTVTFNYLCMSVGGEYLKDKKQNLNDGCFRFRVVGCQVTFLFFRIFSALI